MRTSMPPRLRLRSATLRTCGWGRGRRCLCGSPRRRVHAEPPRARSVRVWLPASSAGVRCVQPRHRQPRRGVGAPAGLRAGQRGIPAQTINNASTCLSHTAYGNQAPHPAKPSARRRRRRTAMYICTRTFTTRHAYKSTMQRCPMPSVVRVPCLHCSPHASCYCCSRLQPIQPHAVPRRTLSLTKPSFVRSASCRALAAASSCSTPASRDASSASRLAAAAAPDVAVAASAAAAPGPAFPRRRFAARSPAGGVMMALCSVCALPKHDGA